MHLLLFGSPVKLAGENEEIAQDGSRQQTGTASDLNLQFAESFTRHYSAISQRYPIYAQLEDLFQLALLAGLVHSPTIQEAVPWNPSWILEGYESRREEVANSVRSIVNYKVLNRRHVIVGVSGGVSVDTRTSMASIPVGGRLVSAGTADSQPPEGARLRGQWWWD